VPQDGDDFLRRRPADAMTLGWQKFTDPATEREFHYHVASHTSQWLDPRHDYTFAGHDGRATYFWPERAEELRAVWKSKFYGAFVLNHRVVLHAIDATPARWRGDAGSSWLDGASAAASSPRDDLVKNCRVHPTHWLISTQVKSKAPHDGRPRAGGDA